MVSCDVAEPVPENSEIFRHDAHFPLPCKKGAALVQMDVRKIVLGRARTAPILRRVPVSRTWLRTPRVESADDRAVRGRVGGTECLPFPIGCVTVG